MSDPDGVEEIEREPTVGSAGGVSDDVVQPEKRVKRGMNISGSTFRFMVTGHAFLHAMKIPK
jgi:hypothetical protein